VADSASPHGHDVNGSLLEPGDRMLHARLQGKKLGVFDVYFDSKAGEQVQAGQARTAENGSSYNGSSYYDVWTSFSPVMAGQGQSEKPREDPIAVRRYVITAEVKPPSRFVPKPGCKWTSGKREHGFSYSSIAIPAD